MERLTIAYKDGRKEVVNVDGHALHGSDLKLTYSDGSEEYRQDVAGVGKTEGAD